MNELQRVFRSAVVVMLLVVLAACAASRAFTRGERAARAGDWDTAVEYYRQAVQDDPDRAEYKIALERATFAASAAHLDRARRAEAEGRLDEALRSYRRGVELDPSNRQAAAKAAEIERTIRERIEAAQPRPEIERLREEARQASAEQLLSPTAPLGPVRFTEASVRDVLNFIGEQTGINVLFDQGFQDRPITINVEGQSLEQVLQQIMLTHQLFYRVIGPQAIVVAQDTAQLRQRYEDQVIRTFYLSHADATEMATLLTSLVVIPGMAIQPRFVPNKTANTVSMRAAAPVARIVERIVEANDKPRAEVVIDVQILEVSRERAKTYGLNLTDYALGAIFSPEVSPADSATAPIGVGSPPPFNLNTISQGISTADFYLAVPAAIVRFLESDSRTKVLAKPQLRGAEGQKVTLNLGEEVPIPSTTFTPLATGGSAVNPLTSFAYRPIGIIVEMLPRVTYDGDVVVDLIIENSARGQDSIIAGQALPSFSSRRVTTRLRLRDGESNLLAGLLREDERRSLRGFPGLIRMPVLRQLFADNDSNIRQTDIVMLMTPRIVRSHELRAQDLSDIFIGTQVNPSLGGPPPLIQAPADLLEPPVVGAEPPPPVPPDPAQPAPDQPPAPGVPVFPPVPAEPAPVTPEPAPPAAAPPATGGGGRITLATPPEMLLGGGPYTVPISISGASRISTLSVSITYNPAVLRVRSVQEGSFMRQGGIAATFTQQVDPSSGRVDIAITRPGDDLGAAGTGLLAAVLFEPIAAGTSPLTPNGTGMVAGGGVAALTFAPATVTVR